jgi:uncharacterized oxidoreductase
MNLEGKPALDTGGSSGIGLAIAEAVLAKGAKFVIRGGEARAKMIALNRGDPAARDKRFADLKPALSEAVRDHSAR